MATDCIAQVTFGFEPKAKPVVALFDMPHASSDGGAVLLKSLDTQLQLTKRVAACLIDGRQAGKVQHETLELLRQRVFGIACGYADCNDAARVADDAIHKLLVDRDPIAGRALASQPTLSRFENAVSWPELRDLAHVLADTVIDTHRRRLKGRATRITIDLDPTDDPTHGQQQFSFFNGHYDTWCYLPVVATVTFNEEPDQFAVAAVLRPGNAPATARGPGDPAAAAGEAARRLSAGHLPGAPGWGLRPPEAVHVSRAAAGRVRRGHGQQRAVGKAGPPVDGQGPDALEGHRPDRAPLRRDPLRRADVDAPAAGDYQGRGRSASRPRAQEQSPLRGHQSGRRPGGGLPLLLRAGGRGESAQGTASRAGDGPDQLLALLGQPVPGPPHAGRLHPVSGAGRRAAKTTCADAQVSTLRERLIKLAVWVQRSARRIVLHLPVSFPWLATWRQLARAVGATRLSRRPQRGSRGRPREESLCPGGDGSLVEGHRR